MARHSRERRAPASAVGQPVRVALALGGNQWHGRFGAPRQVLRAAVLELEVGGLADVTVSRIIETDPIGPSRRCYANAVLTGWWSGDVLALHRLTLALERRFGRRRGQRWGARVLDIDIIALGRDRVRQPRLVVPHKHMAVREFVLAPMKEVWPDWRHPVTGLSVRQMLWRLRSARPAAVRATGVCDEAVRPEVASGGTNA